MADILVTVVGSTTRAYSLAILAGTRVPLTAYRIAKLANLSAPNVYVELRKLARAGVIQREPGGWVLVDDRTRTFCEGRGPLFQNRMSLEAKEEWVNRNRRRIARVLGEPFPPRESSTDPAPPLMREFSRSRTKNTLLKAAGLRVSRHRGR